jgi:hypothetical protein
VVIAINEIEDKETKTSVLAEIDKIAKDLIVAPILLSQI